MSNQPLLTKLSLIGACTCYLSPDTSELTPPNPKQTGWHSIYLPRRDGRLSWPRWSGTVHTAVTIESPIQVVTGPDVEQRCWSSTYVQLMGQWWPVSDDARRRLDVISDNRGRSEAR